MSVYSASSLVFPTSGGRVRLPDVSRSTISAGFDAIAQFDRALLEQQLRRILSATQLAVLSSRAPYMRSELPDGFLTTTGAVMGGVEARATFFIEVRLDEPRLVTLRSALQMQPRLLDPDSLVSPTDPDSETVSSGDPALAPVVALKWTVHIDLIAQTNAQVATLGSTPAVPAELPRMREVRTQLGSGHALLPAHADAHCRQTSAEVWAQLDFAGTRPVYEGDDSASRTFLVGGVGVSMLAAAIAPLLSAPAVRLSPLVAFANGLSAASLAATRLPRLRSRTCVVVGPDRRELLCLCLDAGPENRGTIEAVRAFVGMKNYAHHIGMRILRPVLAARWAANPLLRVAVADTPVEFLDSEGDIVEGVARFRYWLRWPAERIGIDVSDSDRGDPLSIQTDIEILLTNLWDPNGNEILEIGPMQEPDRAGFVWNVHIFAADPDPENPSPTKTILKTLAVTMFKSILRPAAEEWRYDDVSGFTSGPLAALFTSATLNLPGVEPRPGSTVDLRNA